MSEMTIMNKLTIVIVDDNSDVNHLLAAVFSLKGFGTHKTFNADEYLQKLDELKGMVDLVIMNGTIASDRTALLIVKTKRANPKIGVLAVADDESVKTRVLDYGADDFITKPISIETIVDKVNKILLGKEKNNI
jgi:DNA-binding response OmpR family regulator